MLPQSSLQRGGERLSHPLPHSQCSFFSHFRDVHRVVNVNHLEAQIVNAQLVLVIVGLVAVVVPLV